MTKHKLQLIVLFLLISILLRAQLLDVRIGSGFRNHNENINLNNLSSDPKVPSLGVFFKDSSVITADLRIYFANRRKVKISPFIGISYSSEKIHAKNEDYAMLLGDDLSIQNWILYLGYGLFATPKTPNMFIFGYVGISNNKYSGETKLVDSYKATYNYNTSNSLRFAIGQDFYLSQKYNLLGSILLSYDIGAVERDYINVYNGSEYVGKMVPIGDRILPDKVFSIIINIGYSLVI